MSDRRLILADKLVTPDRVIQGGAVLTTGQVIEKVFEGTRADLTREYQDVNVTEVPILMPGVFDAQVHFRDGTLSAKGTINSESRAAVLGGTTDVIHNGNNAEDPTITKEALEGLLQTARESSLVNFGANFLSKGGLDRNNVDEIRKLDPIYVAALKSFLGVSTGGIVTEFKLLPQVIRAAYNLSPELFSIVHSEDTGMISQYESMVRRVYGENEVPQDVNADVRNVMACLSSTLKALESREEAEGNLYVYHVSSKLEADLLKNHYVDNPSVAWETCVHYLLFNEDNYEKLGAFAKCFPAIKSERNRRALVDDVVNGYIKIVSTDHAPHTLDEKTTGDYFSAPGGLPLVQHSLVAMLDLITQELGEVDESLALVSRVMSENPAAQFRATNRGSIAEGNYASMVGIDPNKKWRVDKSNIAYKGGYSPFDGTTFGHSVTDTFVNGSHVVSNGEIIDNDFRAGLLEFKR